MLLTTLVAKLLGIALPSNRSTGYNRNMTAILCVDIGGTQIRAAVYVAGNLQPLAAQRIPTYVAGEAVFERVAAAIQAVWPAEESVEAVSVAAPGPLDPASGLVFSTPNIKEWVNFPLGEKLSERFGCPVFVNNDANLAAVGEWRYGAARGHRNVLYLTISTGIGGGVILDDRLVLGWRGLAAELGHVAVLPDGPVCSCGQRGHLEAVASGPAIASYVRERLQAGERSSLMSEQVTPQAIAEAARRGDALAREAYARAGRFLGQAIADFLHAFNPSVVVLGGGVSQSSDLFLENLHATLTASVMNPIYVRDLVITLAQLGDDAGLVGALAQAEVLLAREHENA